ncbi:hypothetical protein [Tardiphaga sp.]|uniref:hypothetical protein n=1 Tax=Tardiphaga sp. TaxID=1926292 RepID=UPI00262027ED|nr:hypothetical protein [Tardiphaga sp.]MDB5620411.1 hypothetical protein [Tardiphaga sp.]
MAADLQVRRLLNFETATDGSAVRLIVEDLASQRVGIVFTIETVTALLMTLPKMASSAVQQAHGDPAMRVTYPLSQFQIELSPVGTRILTIGTPDGFTVSFSLTDEISRELGEAHLKQPDRRSTKH